MLALAVQVRPVTPQLGDALDIRIQYQKPDRPDLAPRVEFAGKNYPAFKIQAQQWQVLLPTTPLDTPGKKLLKVTGEGETRNLAVWIKNRFFPTQRLWLSPAVNSLEPTPLELQRVKEFKALQTPERYWQGAFLRPNQGPVTTIFGVRRYYNGEFAEDYYHRGIDYGGALGSPVVAPAGGQVALVGLVAQGFRLHGNTVGLDHGQGVTSIFLHLSRVDVREGEMVKAGQVIGAVGATGISTGPHLHWGLYVHGQSIDPVPWLQGWLP
ncbi:M23 family metallopeptidase [Gloeomargarita lithophora]|uniref:M23 family metallopeptidase n=1 Tax=Gloeomargarita lithophora TaxID=1188228 RepID=UPI001C12B84B|nr:M23 family metallopeptidase [Gloeomargarita lithophora]